MNSCSSFFFFSQYNHRVRSISGVGSTVVDPNKSGMLLPLVSLSLVKLCASSFILKQLAL